MRDENRNVYEGKRRSVSESERDNTSDNEKSKRDENKSARNEKRTTDESKRSKRGNGSKTNENDPAAPKPNIEHTTNGTNSAKTFLRISKLGLSFRILRTGRAQPVAESMKVSRLVDIVSRDSIKHLAMTLVN
jgi:hypothetical protein